MSVEFEYVAVVCGGRYENVFDKEIIVKAKNMRHALCLVELQVLDKDVSIVSIEQKD